MAKAARGKKANGRTARRWLPERMRAQRESKREREREREREGSRSDGSYESPARRAHFFGDSKKERDEGARGIARERQIERVAVGGKKGWAVMKRPKGGWRESSLSLCLARREGERAFLLSSSLSLSFSLLPCFLFLSLASLAFFLGEIDQRPRETD